MRCKINIVHTKWFLNSLAFTAILLAGVLKPFGIAAQKDSMAVEEEEELISPSMDFISVQKSNNTIDLKTTIRAKINGSLANLHSLKVTFFALNDSSEKELGAAVTDQYGVARLNVKNDGLAIDKEGKYHFKAFAAGNKSMEKTEEELTIKKALLTLTPMKEDSLLSLQVRLVDLSTGTETPISEADIVILVKRLFKPLPVGEGKTDEEGQTSVEIPANLPADAKGNLQFIARLEDDENFGNLEAALVEKWGIPVSDKIENQPRALWSSNPPVWMLVTFIILMVAVWGHYIVIVYELFRLRKEKPATNITIKKS